ncbi:MAG: DUF3574 domain-containing protein [Chloroflexota bacterium]|nr:DUF3574 domain-containing protein [Chloroflexota bacterium]
MKTRIVLMALLSVAVLALSACDEWGEGRKACPEGTDRWTEYQLFFGLGRSDGGTIPEEEWRAFLADTVTPRFPDGLTVLSGNGQWRDSSGDVLREGSKLLIIYAPRGEDGRRAIDEISEAYERRFDQESVLRVIGSACVSFS